MKLCNIVFAVSLCITASSAWADPPTANGGTPGATSAPTPAGENLPAPVSGHDEAPPVAAPALPQGGIVRQAGIGGEVGYGRPGVLELGGSAGFTIADNYRNVAVAPSIGWFLADNLELSGILSLSYVKAGDPGTSATIFSALVEPSYHLPFNRSTFGFLGLGLGVSAGTAVSTGFAIAPRIGANFLVGRSGVLSPYLSYQYASSSSSSGDATVVAISTQTRLNIGYTVMW